VLYLVPDNSTLTCPTLRHPNLQPKNVLISDDLEITGLIDWQHYSILPLLFQYGIPNDLQNYGDSVSKSLIPPRLPVDFDNLNDEDKFVQVLLCRRRQLPYEYFASTEKLNTIHYHALS
jgi:hypothetical protein